MTFMLRVPAVWYWALASDKRFSSFSIVYLKITQHPIKFRTYSGFSVLRAVLWVLIDRGSEVIGLLMFCNGGATICWDGSCIGQQFAFTDVNKIVCGQNLNIISVARCSLHSLLLIVPYYFPWGFGKYFLYRVSNIWYCNSHIDFMKDVLVDCTAHNSTLFEVSAMCINT
jgi:hypothetical protein